MARLQTSGTISIEDISAEFGGGESLEDYYRNGSEVPTNSVNGSVPTSGTITLEDFYGADPTEIVTASAFQFSPTNPFVTYTTTGGITVSSGTNRTWHRNGGPGADYEIRATLTSGSGISGTLGSWLALSTNRTWTKTTNGIATLSIHIRDASTNVTVDTGTATLERGTSL